MHQQDLFEKVVSIYRNQARHGTGEIDNTQLYQALDMAEGERTPVGRRGEPHNLAHRKVRWSQQTAKRLGLIERTPGKRGVWRLAPSARKDELTPAPDGQAHVAFSTKLGLAIWASHESVLPKMTEQIHAVITSPPYALRIPRAYGNPDASEYADFICRSLEPLLKNLVPGGVVALNLSQDSFVPGLPSRSTFLERTIIAIEDRLGLHLFERAVWRNPTRPPGPTYWACRTRQQLAATYEPIYLFTNDPAKLRTDNRRVLQPHTDKHKRLMAAGGEKRSVTYGDGAYKLRPGKSFANETVGKLARNVLDFSHTSREVEATRRAAIAAGLPTHGALMPVRLAKFLVEFTTAPDELVVDLFSGWNTVGLAAEMAGRRWLAIERLAQYAAGAALRFRHLEGFLSSVDIELTAVDGLERCWPEHALEAA